MKKDPEQLYRQLSMYQKMKEKELKKLHSEFSPERLNEFVKVDKCCESTRSSLTEYMHELLDEICFSTSAGETALQSLLQRMDKMKEELDNTNCAMREKDDELISFKDRVAGEVASSIRTGKAVNLNNPVSRPRLRELYEDLRCNWSKTKKELKSTKDNPDSAKEKIKKRFEEAKTRMLEKIRKIDEIFGWNIDESDRSSSKVQEYRQLTIQNLQLAIYSEKEDDLKVSEPEHTTENPENVLKQFWDYCYWLGCLMSLNDPPLELDWRHHPQSQDKWDILPQNITESVTVEDKKQGTYM